MSTTLPTLRASLFAAAMAFTASLAGDASAITIVDDETYATYRYAFGVSELNLLQHEQAVVDLYLVETPSTSDTHPLSLDYLEGLLSAGVTVERDPLGLTSITVVGAAGDPATLGTPSASFDAASLTILLDDAAAPSLPAPDINGERWFRLGQMTVDAGGVLGSTTFDATNPLGVDDTLTELGLLLDDDIAPAELLVTVVPEPASLALVGAGLLLVMPRRRS
jgi:hypothetical protein